MKDSNLPLGFGMVPAEEKVTAKRPKSEEARPVIGSTVDTEQRVWYDAERPIPGDIYPVIDTDLGRDNVENDLPAADLEDL